jgi:hypothetical protein
MYCPNCGTLLSAGATSCSHCGWYEGGPITNVNPWAERDTSFTPHPSSGYSKDIADDPVMRLLLPVGRSFWAIAATDNSMAVKITTPFFIIITF